VCRLITYIGAPISPEHLVFGGSHSLYEQSWAPRELLSGSVNADGYGVAWYAEGGPGRIAESRPIWYDQDLPSTLGAIRSGCMLAALRNGTPGIPVDRSGLLPMVHGRWTFILNGFVPDFRARHMRSLRADLPDPLYAALSGASDSETLFLLAVAEVEGGATLVEALSATAQKVKARVGKDETQMNMVLSDGTTIAAVRSSTALMSNSLYIAEHPPFAAEGIVLASEPPEPGAVWAAVDGDSWIEIDANGTIRTDTLFLD